MRPWLDTMFAVDDAERRGDARGALELMNEHPFDPDGKPFWRPWRINRLFQVVLLGSSLPAWAVSRWIAAQAHETLGEPGDRRRRRCLEHALDVRGGIDGLSIHGETDALCKLMDHDWVYRQLFLYELGGLSDFIRSAATPDLLAGADHIRAWCQAPMSALRVLGRSSRSITWECINDGRELEVPNIGSAALVVPGDHVLGRLVPTSDGVMLEAAPLVVPVAAAESVAADSTSWWRAVAACRDEVHTGGYEHGIVNDVRDMIWQLVLAGPAEALPPVAEVDPWLGRRTLALARDCLDEAQVWEDDAVDPWACLHAAMLSRRVLAGLAEVAGPPEAEQFRRLAPMLAAPADMVCRNVALELTSAAA